MVVYALPRCPIAADLRAPPVTIRSSCLWCPDCQRLSTRGIPRAKLQNDPLYRAQCRDSQKQWREQNPSYMRLPPIATGATTGGAARTGKRNTLLRS